MNLGLPITVTKIIETITAAGYTCEIVGGAVRDILVGKETTDWDFATNATPEQILPLFSESFYENQYGTVMVAQKHLREQFQLKADPPLADTPDLIYDITTYRSDGEYRNHRKPESVTWGETIEEDLQRRDFTINAVALRANSTGHRLQATVDATIIDPYNGQIDLERKIIRTVRDPNERFAEDALRMLRAVRFAVQLGFVIEKETGDAITKHAEHLVNISDERISIEFLKMLGSNRPASAIFLLDQFGLLQHVLPELLATKGVKQSGHHIYDVWEHSIRALGACESDDPVVRLATLLHDIGKPATQKDGANGTVTFYNHEVVGARIAKQIAMRLRLPKKECDRIFTLVRWHMFTYESFVTDAYIRRFIRRVGVENLEDMFFLRIGDRVGSGSKATSWRLEELKDRVWAQLHQPLKVTDLAINGNDIMKELEIKPGPQIGKILNALFEQVLENPKLNTKEQLLNKLQSLVTF